MINQIVPAVASGVGSALLILSFVWPSVTDPDAAWTANQAQDRGDAIAELHGHSCDCHPPASDQAIEHAKERMRRSDIALQEVLDQRSRLVNAFKWSGIVIVMIGAITLVATEKSTHKRSLDSEAGLKV